ncbi:hypothetical protein PoB_006736200 [Plakobranchus ocellatus]|uniref:Uncharacterized protein n=1 Tax=Plakobranchus ocellatus TaxID=259542 RepID=A0AAV4D9M3_9GAST|nr:hypothetical protein PoB_006736200 [Plakobranchus ocellatus]
MLATASDDLILGVLKQPKNQDPLHSEKQNFICAVVAIAWLKTQSLHQPLLYHGLKTSFIDIPRAAFIKEMTVTNPTDGHFDGWAERSLVLAESGGFRKS